MWQDLVIMIGGFVLAIALIPTLLSKDKPPKSTCFITGGTLLVFSICYVTLGLYLAFFSTLLTSVIWFVIFFQKIFYQKNNSIRPASLK
jgi:hypothetical protein